MWVRDAILDRPETEIDHPEAVSQFRPTGMVLLAGRSEVVVSVEIHPERPGLHQGRNRK